MLEDAMTARIVNVLIGLWLFASAFILPQGRGQLASTAICGLLVTLTAALTSYEHRFRYVTEALGLLVVVLAFAVHPLGSATFWHNGIMGYRPWRPRSRTAARWPSATSAISSVA
jgi:hypothetical protein